jgi:YidC/Oxa1 family membrane protein insertase
MDTNRLLGYTLLFYIIFLFFQHNNKNVHTQEKKTDDIQTHWYDMDLKHNNALSGEKEYILENEELKVHFSSLGGCIKKVELKKHKNFSGGSVILLNQDSSILNFKICNGKQCLDTYNKIFDVSTHPEKIVFEYKYNNGDKIIQTYSFDPQSKFSIQYSLSVSNGDIKEFNLFLDNSLLQQETNFKDCQLHSNITFCNKKGKVDTVVQHLERHVEKNQLSLKWIAFKQKFFTTGLVFGNDNNTDMCLFQSSDKVLQHSKLSVNITTEKNVLVKYYFGPNELNNLKPFTDKFETIVYCGFPGVRVVNKYLVLPMIGFLHNKGVNVVLILLLLVLFLKLLLFPFGLHVQRMTEQLKKINHLLQRLGEKYKDNPQQLAFEQLKLYKQYGINPFTLIIGGLIQVPFIIAVFNAVPIAMAFRGEKFLWCRDLSSYDSILNFNFSIPFYGDHISLMALLMVVITSLYLVLDGSISRAGKNVKILMAMSTIMMIFFSNRFCAALNIYYILFSVFTICTNYFTKKLIQNNIAKT